MISALESLKTRLDPSAGPPEGAACAPRPIRKSPALACLCAVSLLLVPDASAAQLSLSWADNSSNETGFKVERATGSGAFSQITTTGANVTSLTDTSLNAATTYSYRVRAYNSSGISSYSNVASMTTPSATNTAPTISNIADQTITTNGTTGAIAFTIGDAQTSAGSLTLTRSSSNTTLAPTSSIVLGGSGANRTVTVTPAANQTGTATITVAVSDGTLTASDTFVLTVSSAQPTGLAGYWKFDEGAGTQAADSSGQGRVGTLLKATGWTTGKLGGALAFTTADANDRVDMGNFNVSGNKLTLAAWIYVKSIGSDPRIIAKSTGTQTNDLYWLLEIDDGSTPRLGFRVHSGGSLLRLTGGSVEKNQWIHVAGVYDGTTMRIYKNGVEVAKNAKSGSLRTGSASVWVGDNPPNAQRPFEGSIDDVQVYSRALSVAEVQGLHKAQAVSTGSVATTSAATTTSTTTTSSSSTTSQTNPVSNTSSLTSSDVGNPAIAGSTSYAASTDTHQVKAAGIDIWGSSDQFRFVHQKVDGDVTLIV